MICQTLLLFSNYLTHFSNFTKKMATSPPVRRPHDDDSDDSTVNNSLPHSNHVCSPTNSSPIRLPAWVQIEFKWDSNCGRLDDKWWQSWHGAQPNLCGMNLCLARFLKLLHVIDRRSNEIFKKCFLFRLTLSCATLRYLFLSCLTLPWWVALTCLT